MLSLLSLLLVLGAEGTRVLEMAHALAVVANVCMYVCMVIKYSRIWINRVRLPILLVVS